MVSTHSHIIRDGGSTTLPDETLPDELQALRSVAQRNMRLLRAQIVPLIDAALRSGGGEHDGHRARWTDAALRLIDETTIAAAAGATGGPIVPVDMGALLSRATGRYADRLGEVKISDLPCFMARRDRLALLVEDVVANTARAAPHLVPAGLCIDWALDDRGDAVIRFRDASLAGERAIAGRDDSVDLERRWSIGRTLIAGMGGGFHMSGAGRGRLCLDLRFPADMVLVDGAV